MSGGAAGAPAVEKPANQPPAQAPQQAPPDRERKPRHFFWHVRDGILEHPLTTLDRHRMSDALHGLDDAPIGQRQGVLLAVCDLL